MTGSKPRLSKLHRQAILLLFLNGYRPLQLARAYHLTVREVEAVLRQAMR